VASQGLGQIENYQIITRRNAFGLRELTPPTPMEPAPAAERPRIMLTGITTILGDKRALLQSIPPPGKPGEPKTSAQFLIMTEGESIDGLQIIQVDARAGVVVVNNSGVTQALKLQELSDNAGLNPCPPPPPAALPIPANAFAYRD
jgi:hypothetical protein